MDNINNNPLRVGRFTSSQMHRLCGGDNKSTWKVYKDKATFESGGRSSKNFDVEREAKKYNAEKKGSFLLEVKPPLPTKFYTYVQEVFYARMLGRSIKTQVKTQSMKWGKLMEIVLFELLGTNYKMEHKNTLLHKEHGAFWSGTPDLEVKGVKTGEIKCFEPLHFAQLSYALLTKDTEYIKENEPDAYWQAVSNSIICGYDKTEIIAYMPYRAELVAILKQIEEGNFLERNGLEQSDYWFMQLDNIEGLSYLPDDSKFSNVNTFEFAIPKEDKELLITRVLLANEELEKLTLKTK